MNDADDRLAGDLVWELFPVQPAEKRSTRFLHILEVAFVVALTWFLSQPLSVAIVCLAISFKDFRDGWRLGKSIPDKAGGTICALFTYSWGAWKLGIFAFTSFCVLAALNVSVLQERNMFPGEGAAMAFILVPIGLLASTILTAAGLFMALRSGMRVWIGEGMNQARTLVLALLIVIFTFCVLIPLTLSMIARFPGVGGNPNRIPFEMIGVLGCLFGGPVIILMILDRISRRILADQPGKFGPKVPTVRKWEK